MQLACIITDAETFLCTLVWIYVMCQDGEAKLAGSIVRLNNTRIPLWLRRKIVKKALFSPPVCLKLQRPAINHIKIQVFFATLPKELLLQQEYMALSLSWREAIHGQDTLLVLLTVREI